MVKPNYDTTFEFRVSSQYGKYIVYAFKKKNIN